MALTTLHWFSPILGKQTTAQVILPETGRPPFATLYLLHGLGDDSSAWLRRTRIEHYARELPLIVVMPDGYRSFYTRPTAGPDYATHIGVELPDCMERYFNARPERAGRAIGGLSMGGYGALRIGLGFAHRFCSVNSHSGAVAWCGMDLKNQFAKHPSLQGYEADFQRELRAIFGDDPRNTEHDLAGLALQAQATGQLPRLLLDCGTDDFLLADNRAFRERLQADAVPHQYQEFPGTHDWDYWDLHVRDALAFHAANLGLQA